MAHILVVEDEGSIRLFIRSVLQQKGHDIVEAVNGLEGLHCLEGDTDFALMITDLRMPVMSGAELTEKARRQFPHLPILLISAYLDQEWSTLNNGIDFFLAKPFSHAALISATHLSLLGLLSSEN